MYTGQDDPKRIASAALQAFFNLAERWQLTESQERILIGSPSDTVFFKWKTEKTSEQLNPETLERISYLLGIYKDLNQLLPSNHSADAWVHKDNSAPIFHGKSALEKMLSGSVVDLMEVRRYLDSQTEL